MAADPNDTPPLICGVRIGRGGPLLWSSTDDSESLQPGDLVVISQDETETLATVIVAPSQLIEADPGLLLVGQVVPLAGDAEQLRLGRAAARALDATAQVTAQCAPQGVALQISDASLAPDHSRLYLVLEGQLPQGFEGLGLELARLFGLPVDLLERGPAGLQPRTGLSTTGLPPSWSDWIVLPGSEPELRPGLMPDLPAASYFISRLFQRA